MKITYSEKSQTHKCKQAKMAKPTNADWKTHKNIFHKCILISHFIFQELIMPYQYINFLVYRPVLYYNKPKYAYIFHQICQFLPKHSVLMYKSCVKLPKLVLKVAKITIKLPKLPRSCQKYHKANQISLESCLIVKLSMCKAAQITTKLPKLCPKLSKFYANLPKLYQRTAQISP